MENSANNNANNNANNSVNNNANVDLQLLELINKSNVLVCVGSGGVGKTTVSSALAYKAAEMGRRVLVLTVDPAKRLKTTMGIKEGNEIVQLHPEGLKGELWAAVIDPKKTFDEFVLRAANQSESAKKILKNKLYIQLSTTLSGSQEFTALERLYSAKESGKYDLIVLDTPPTKHAIDFLESPQKLSSLFTESVMKWFRNPEGRNIFVKVVQAGTQKVLKALENLTGSEFMQELADFFRTIETWQGKLEQRISDVQRLLVDSKTNFILVTSLDQAKIKEGKYFIREIHKGGYHLSSIIINRAYPQWTLVSESDAKDIKSNPSDIETQMRSFYEKRKQSIDSLKKEVNFVKLLPELENNISDFEGVKKIAAELA